jgi:23S rRNA (cytosine1962-C5)-methyltransferase
MGHSQSGSVAVKIFSFEKVTPDESFWKKKIEKAYLLRKALGLVNNTNTNAYRLVNAEGDGLPGLIIDIFNEAAIIQTHSAAMYLMREMLFDILEGLLKAPLKAIYLSSDGALPGKSGSGTDYRLIGQAPVVRQALENGLQFNINPEKPQKSGFFLDRRECRALFGHYSHGRSVLDIFCHTGAFSLYALKEGAKQVHSVDSSERAIEVCRKNVTLNFPQENRHEAFPEDAFKFLDKAAGKYDLMVIDPPAFAKHQKVVHNALQGYRKLNIKAIETIRPGGIIFTFSSSQVVSREAFRKTVFSAAAKTGRTVRILHQMEQSADHPIDIFHPEGEYLKGLVLHVE